MAIDTLQPGGRYTLPPRCGWRRHRSALCEYTLLRFPHSAGASIFSDDSQRLHTGHSAFAATTAQRTIEWVGVHEILARMILSSVWVVAILFFAKAQAKWFAAALSPHVDVSIVFSRVIDSVIVVSNPVNELGRVFADHHHGLFVADAPLSGVLGCGAVVGLVSCVGCHGVFGWVLGWVFWGEQVRQR